MCVHYYCCCCCCSCTVPVGWTQPDYHNSLITSGPEFTLHNNAISPAMAKISSRLIIEVLAMIISPTARDFLLAEQYIKVGLCSVMATNTGTASPTNHCLMYLLPMVRGSIIASWRMITIKDRNYPLHSEWQRQPWPWHMHNECPPAPSICPVNQMQLIIFMQICLGLKEIFSGDVDTRCSMVVENDSCGVC